MLVEADKEPATNVRTVYKLVIDNKNFCAMRVKDVSETCGAFVAIHYDFINRVNKKEKIEFGDDKNCQLD